MVSPGSHNTLERDSSCLVSFSGGWSLRTKKSLSFAVKWVTRVFLSPAHIAAGVPGCMVHTKVVVSHRRSQLLGKKLHLSVQLGKSGAGLGS